MKVHQHYMPSQEIKITYVNINRCRESLWNNLAPAMIKTFNKLGIDGTFLSIVKAIYHKPTANVILNEEKLKPYCLVSGTRQVSSHLPPQFNAILEVLAIATRQEIRYQSFQIGREVFRLFLFEDDIKYT